MRIMQKRKKVGDATGIYISMWQADAELGRKKGEKDRRQRQRQRQGRPEQGLATN